MTSTLFRSLPPRCRRCAHLIDKHTNFYIEWDRRAFAFYVGWAADFEDPRCVRCTCSLFTSRLRSTTLEEYGALDLQGAVLRPRTDPKTVQGGFRLPPDS